MFNDVIKRSGKSLREIEELTGVSYSRLSLVLNDEISPSFDTIHRLIVGLKLSDREIIAIMRQGNLKSKSYRLKNHNTEKDIVVKDKGGK